MTVAETIDVRQLLGSDEPMQPDEIERLIEAITGSQLPEIRREVAQLRAQADAGEKLSKAALVRLGVALYFLGRHDAADKYLAEAKRDPLGAYYHALVASTQGRSEQAEQAFQKAEAAGYDRIECTLRRAGEMRKQGRLEEAEQVLRGVSKEAAGRAEYSYQMGCIFADRSDSDRAIEYFERAVDMQPDHSRALFRLAHENALHGDDREAIRLYEQSLSKPPYHLGALLNLGLLYEDQGNYPAAAYCFRRILEFDPNHARARLYLKDIEAASEMYYDEESARSAARLEQLLSRPINDFELSVRSRNCLQGMDIHTLGDLTRVSEQELLAGKNFGETSLEEIREVLQSHGLRIGQNLHETKPEAPAPQPQLSPEEQALLSKPLSELNLSVRARKCMARLGLTTVGELIRRTPDELLSSRNFGVTSLNELRSKLAELGLRLRND